MKTKVIIAVAMAITMLFVYGLYFKLNRQQDNLTALQKISDYQGGSDAERTEKVQLIDKIQDPKEKRTKILAIAMTNDVSYIPALFNAYVSSSNESDKRAYCHAIYVLSEEIGISYAKNIAPHEVLNGFQSTINDIKEHGYHGYK